MFTPDQIKSAHSKVKSGADFPRYIADLATLGISHYITYASDGHTEYYGHDANMLSFSPRYESKHIAPIASAKQLADDLKVHQAGGSDYPTFCSQAAKNGVNSWSVDINMMTCTYHDIDGNNIVEEVIPKY